MSAFRRTDRLDQTSITTWLAAAERGDLRILERMYRGQPSLLDAFGIEFRPGRVRLGSHSLCLCAAAAARVRAACPPRCDARHLHGQRAMVTFLLEAGASATTIPSPLPGAVEGGDATIPRRLLAAGADPNVFGPNGHAALHAACIRGKLPVVRLLLSHGARLDVRERQYDATPLGWAEHFHRARVARLLRSRGGRR